MKNCSSIFNIKFLKVNLFIMSLFVLSANLFAEETDDKEKIEWHTDYKKATEVAKKDNKPLLLVFSGSDWCANCMRLDKSVFQSQVFKDFANKQLIFAKADFPMKSRNALPEEVKEQNENLAEKYNKEGKFPMMMIFFKDTQKEIFFKTTDPQNYINQISKAVGLEPE